MVGIVFRLASNLRNFALLYLAGYIGIELQSPGKAPLPTVITEKGKRVLEPKSLGFIYFSNPAIGSSTT